MGSDVEVTQADREKAQQILDTAPLLDMGTAIAQALAEERAKARAQVASDLTDLIIDSLDNPSRDALVDFIYGLESQ